MMWKMVASNFISQPTGVVVEFNAIVNIRKYKRFHEGHHFILMAMDVHDTLGCDMDHFIRECAHLFHDRQSSGHLFLFFCIQFFRECVSISLQLALTFVIKSKIMLAGDACSKHPILDLMNCM